MSISEIDIEIVEINEMSVEIEVDETELNEAEKENHVPENRPPMELPGYHLFVKAYLGEQEIELVLDTGASKSVFDPTLLEGHIELSETDDSIQSMSVNSELEIGFGHIKSFHLGDVLRTQMPVGFTSLAAVNQMYESIIGKKIWGLLGSDFLMAYKARIDYGTSKLFLYQED